MLGPADGSTEQGTLADYEPVFNAITKSYGLHFDLKAGQSYNAIVEAMDTGKIEIAFFGSVTNHLPELSGRIEYADQTDASDEHSTNFLYAIPFLRTRFDF